MCIRDRPGAWPDIANGDHRIFGGVRQCGIRIQDKSPDTVDQGHRILDDDIRWNGVARLPLQPGDDLLCDSDVA